MPAPDPEMLVFLVRNSRGKPPSTCSSLLGYQGRTIKTAGTCAFNPKERRRRREVSGRGTLASLRINGNRISSTTPKRVRPGKMEHDLSRGRGRLHRPILEGPVAIPLDLGKPFRVTNSGLTRWVDQVFISLGVMERYRLCRCPAVAWVPAGRGRKLERVRQQDVLCTSSPKGSCSCLTHSLSPCYE